LEPRDRAFARLLVVSLMRCCCFCHMYVLHTNVSSNTNPSFR
jgi:hypothetical protein